MNNNNGPTATARRRGWWRYVVVAVLVVGVGGLTMVLASNGTLKKWLSRERGNAASTGQLWTCGMHPQVIQDHPGLCPICHMDLTPLRAGSSSAAEGMPSATVTIDPVVVQNMGVRTARVTQGRLQATVRAVGLLKEAEPNVRDVNLRLSGWVEKLYANTEGMHVSKGDPLFDLYSPQLQTAVEELLASRRASSAPGGDHLATQSTAALYDSAERKLELLGLSKEQVDQLAKLDRAPRTVKFTSPVSGHVIEKGVVEGAAVKEGERALRIVDHSTLWLDAQVYESQLPFIKQGQKATATVASLPGKTFEGEVVFVHPHVDPTTRTVMVRLVVPNESLVLKPGMYATVLIAAELADQAVMVPREAVIDTGTRQIVFVARERGQFEPRNVRMGASGQDGVVQVLEGLSPGDTVVISGQFLIDAESRMKEAIEKHLRDKLQGPEPTPEHVAGIPSPQPRSETAPAVPSPTTATVAAPEQQGGESRDSTVDAVAKAYLRLSDFFGKPQKGDQPADVQPLFDAAQGLAANVAPEKKPLVEKVLKAATDLKGQPIQQQRKLFKPLSESVIALVDQVPPSKSVAGKLLVMHCPMADENRGADWLQVTEPLANPYFATSMKQCGEVKRTIDLPGKT
jgi:Cu(I)/Ag(I) efflux system membrane fusion protein